MTTHSTTTRAGSGAVQAEERCQGTVCALDDQGRRSIRPCVDDPGHEGVCRYQPESSWPELAQPACEAAQPESVEAHLVEGQTPAAAVALLWRETMSCCGHPVREPGAMQLLCSTCAAFYGAAVFSCRGCGVSGPEPLGWFLAKVVEL